MTAIRYTLILALIFLPASPFATTFPVTKTADTNDGTCDADCSLREAIDAANTNPGADDVPVPAGTYLLTLGELRVSDDVSIAGAGQANTIIDGNAADRVFNIEATNGVVGISGVTIQNGYAYHSGGGISNDYGGDLTLTNSTVSGNAAYYGGGISNRYYGGDLTLTNSTVSGNTAYDGGGIWNGSYYGVLTLTNSTVSGNAAYYGGGISDRSYHGVLTLTNSTVTNNTANWSGGGIRSYSSGGNRRDLTLTNSTVSGNTAYRGSGGGIWNSLYSGDLTLTNSTVSGNTANNGGGIWNYSRDDFTLTNSTVSGNTAHYYGGGISNNGAKLTLTNSTVSDNTASSDYGGGGGGISNSVGDYGELTLTNSTVSGNTAHSYGGGILSSYAKLTLTNSTVSGNTVPYGSGGGIWNSPYSEGVLTLTNSTVSGNEANQSGAGIYIYRGDSGGYTTLIDTIVADNGTTTPNCNDALGSLGYNLTDDDSCGFTAPGDLVVADAMLGPLADNGGPTETHALLAGSPAIDAGSPDCPPPATDQRGVLRPQGAGCDIGSVESLSKKVTMCHKGKNLISLPANAVPGHLAHGDTLGACP